MTSQDPYPLVRADVEEQVRLLNSRNGQLQAAVWAGGANVTSLAHKLGCDCDAVLAQIEEIEKALDFAASAPHRFNISTADLQARRAWISATRDSVRRTAQDVAPHRPPPPHPQPVALGIPVAPATPATSTSFGAPYSSASAPCLRGSGPGTGSLRVASAIADAAAANAAYAAAATVAAASNIPPVRAAATAAHTATSFTASVAHRAASGAVGAAHTAAAAGGAVLGGAGGFISGQVQAQERALRHQDGLLDQLDASLGRIADQGRRIGRELEEQTGMLRHLESGVDAAVGGIRGAHRRALGLLRGR
ncbi:hypothetical protein HYH02_009525 [Chlamydomonas schloesseri]|uniref:t-SNARE coiled-coil homology domain-containing protein n=1 Tax=Chlamydomonas schloesseri TaxID=2026947 RepID=A0A835W772_9CHLO|nr:hypothetical protein HYH02_009525 [Chlamydomonas schloesseri]|eukprot:KAG2443112.1 hypothetical protein HYH02_009525 [Chlamydomonas schloesseri]